MKADNETALKKVTGVLQGTMTRVIDIDNVKTEIIK